MRAAGCRTCTLCLSLCLSPQQESRDGPELKGKPDIRLLVYFHSRVSLKHGDRFRLFVPFCSGLEILNTKLL